MWLLHGLGGRFNMHILHIFIQHFPKCTSKLKEEQTPHFYNVGSHLKHIGMFKGHQHNMYTTFVKSFLMAGKLRVVRKYFILKKPRECVNCFSFEEQRILSQ